MYNPSRLPIIFVLRLDHSPSASRIAESNSSLSWHQKLLEIINQDSLQPFPIMVTMQFSPFVIQCHEMT
jgi:hypothetical protein